jgi:hypothetical protein
MVDHLKKFLMLHISIIITVTLIVAQTADHYLTTHPKVEFGSLMGAMGLAMFNYFMTSPKDK